MARPAEDIILEKLYRDTLGNALGQDLLVLPNLKKSAVSTRHLGLGADIRSVWIPEYAEQALGPSVVVSFDTLGLGDAVNEREAASA